MLKKLSKNYRQTTEKHRLQNVSTKNQVKKDPNTSTESALTDKLGMRVFINNKKNNSGTLTFEYKDLDQLDRLIGVIKNNY